MVSPILAQADEGIVPLVRNGNAGFWVPRTLWIEAETRYEEAPKLKLEVEALRLQVGTLESQVKILNQTATVAQSLADGWRAAYLDERKLRREADRDVLKAAERRWYESPLWPFIGGGLTVALGVLAVAKFVPDRVLVPQQ
jgi:hypothetical protein